MKMLAWQRLLGEQARRGKVLFTVTELANASGAPRRVVNVEMSRLVKRGVAVRWAKGLYALADAAVPPEQVAGALDPHAYVTGAWALHRHSIVTQVPAVITVFTCRRHFRRELDTPAGRLEFVCVRPPVYRREGIVAGPEQALFDYVYVCRRRRMDPRALLTFRRADALRRSVLTRVKKRYPATVRAAVATIVRS